MANVNISRYISQITAVFTGISQANVSMIANGKADESPRSRFALKVVAQATVTMVMSGHKCILIRNVQNYMYLLRASSSADKNNLAGALHYSFLCFKSGSFSLWMLVYYCSPVPFGYILFLAWISVKQGYPIQVCIQLPLLFLSPVEKCVPTESLQIHEQKHFKPCKHFIEPNAFLRNVIILQFIT